MRTEPAATPLRPGPHAMLFDLDGTLVDSLPEIASALDAARAGLGHEPVRDLARVRSWVGGGARLLVARSLGLPEVHAEVDPLLEAFRRVYDEAAGRHVALYPGVGRLLEHLASLGFPLAVVTNKPRVATRVLLGRLGIRHLFGAVITPDDVGGRTKPDPTMLLEALQQLGVKRNHALLVGDGVADVEAGRRAGVRVLAALWGYGDETQLREAGAEDPVTGAEEVLAIALRLRAQA